MVKKTGLPRVLGLPVLIFALAMPACASPERLEAEHALAWWRNTRPLQYTYVLQPIGFSSHEPVRVRVQNEEVIDAVERSGARPAHHHVSMTELLKEAVAMADDEGFSASYNADFGYIESFFYGAGRSTARGYGFEVTCFEPTLEDDACDSSFEPPEVTQP